MKFSAKEIAEEIRDASLLDVNSKCDNSVPAENSTDSKIVAKRHASL